MATESQDDGRSKAGEHNGNGLTGTPAPAVQRYIRVRTSEFEYETHEAPGKQYLDMVYCRFDYFNRTPIWSEILRQQPTERRTAQSASTKQNREPRTTKEPYRYGVRWLRADGNSSVTTQWTYLL